CRSVFFFCLMARLPLRATLFPYTTLFRSATVAASATGTYVPKIDDRRTTIRLMDDSVAVRPRSMGAVAAGTPHPPAPGALATRRSEEHTSELQSLAYLVCRLLLEKKTMMIPPILILHPRHETSIPPHHILHHPPLFPFLPSTHPPSLPQFHILCRRYPPGLLLDFF